MQDTRNITIENAVKFTQTGRTGWVTKLSVGQIVTLLPQRPHKQLNMLTDTNRPVSEHHTQGIIQFLESNAPHSTRRMQP